MLAIPPSCKVETSLVKNQRLSDDDTRGANRAFLKYLAIFNKGEESASVRTEAGFEAQQRRRRLKRPTRLDPGFIESLLHFFLLKGLPCVEWHGGETRGTLDGWGCSEPPQSGLVPRVTW